MGTVLIVLLTVAMMLGILSVFACNKWGIFTKVNDKESK